MAERDKQFSTKEGVSGHVVADGVSQEVFVEVGGKNVVLGNGNQSSEELVQNRWTQMLRDADRRIAKGKVEDKYTGKNRWAC